MKNHRTAARARLDLGVTIPLVGLFGGIRVDVGFEDYERPEDGGTEGLRRRVRRTALGDLRREVRAALKRYNLDNTGKPKEGKQTRWL
jgi:hypothetical protein